MDTNAGPDAAPRPTAAAATTQSGVPYDPAVAVWQEDAFCSFRPSADYAQMRTLLSTSSRYLWDDRPPGGVPRLPRLFCGAPDSVRPDHRCGFALNAMRNEGMRYNYTSVRCAEGQGAHRASVGRFVEEPVLEMLAEAYTPEAMAAAVNGVVERAAVAKQHLAAFDRRLKRREDDYERAAHLENEAHRASHADNIEHWGRERVAAQQARNALLQERAAFARSLTEYVPAGGLEPQLALEQFAIDRSKVGGVRRPG